MDPDGKQVDGERGITGGGRVARDSDAHLEVPDEGGDAAVRLVVVLLVGKLLQLGQKRNRVPRGEQGQQVRREELRHLSLDRYGKGLLSDNTTMKQQTELSGQS